MSSLAERCSQALHTAGVTFQREADGALRVPARCQEVGDLVVAFDGGEITVFIGNLTHCHFTPGASGTLESTDQIGECVGEAADFVSSVLQDRWVLWTSATGLGGSYEVGDEHNPMADGPLPGEDVVRFCWSGPIRTDGSA